MVLIRYNLLGAQAITSIHLNATATADMSSSSATSLATPVPASSPETTNSASHTQIQLPYYMPPPFSIPFTAGQPPFLVSGPYPPMSYVPRPAYMYRPPIPGSFQAFQYAPRNLGHMACDHIRMHRGVMAVSSVSPSPCPSFMMTPPPPSSTAASSPPVVDSDRVRLTLISPFLLLPTCLFIQ